MSGDDNKRAVAEFVERCQNQHDLGFADEVFHPEFVNHYRPGARWLIVTRLASRPRFHRIAAIGRWTEGSRPFQNQP